MLGEAVVAERGSLGVALFVVFRRIDAHPRSPRLRGLTAHEGLPDDLEERRRVRVHGPPEPHPLERAAQEELTLSAGEADVEEPNLLVVLRGVPVAALERDELILAPGDHDGVELEALRRV